MPHLHPHIKHKHLSSDSTLHVIGVLSNPVRYHSRYRLARKWLKEMEETEGVQVHVVEAAYGDREWEVTEKGNPRHLQVRIKSEIWIKENLINLGVKHLLPKDWKYMAWVDMDVHFQQLQHYNIIQPWSDAADLDFYGGIHQHSKSFGSLHAKQKRKWHGRGKDGYEYAHTGFAWACTRYFYENVQKLADFNIVGAGDHLMAWACIGLVNETMPKDISTGYKWLCHDWERKAQYATAGMVGFTPGRIEHHWHGNKVNRQYWNRWEILRKNKYDPTTDIAYDSQGIIHAIGPHKYDLERDIMLYNRQRREDGEL